MKKFFALFVLILLASCRNSNQKAPTGTRWGGPDGQWLIDEKSGTSIAAYAPALFGFGDANVWLYECGNDNKYFENTNLAIQAVINCGKQYEANKNHDR